MTTILGISAFYHDSAAALVEDGRIVAAAQEERFSRVKHDHRFPKSAIDYCLAEGGVGPDRLDAVAFYDKPFLKFERLLETYLAFAPRGLRSFMQAMPLWLRQKLFLPREIDRGLENAYEGPIYFARHHESHAASAFYPSPFEEAAVITFDGVGEWTTTSWGVGRSNRVVLKQEIRFPHSLGLLYSAFTYYTGFKVNSGEYKVMGLAPYGDPRYADRILREVMDLKEDGSFRLDQRYFRYCHGLTMTSERFHRLFEGPPRRPESPLTQKHMDLAASVQKVTEEVLLRIARHVHEKTGQENLCLAGGVALNCVGNGRILREGPFRRVWIQPAAGDAGGALGAALLSWHRILGKPRTPSQPDGQAGSYLGPAFSNGEIRETLDGLGAVSTVIEEEEALCRRIAELLEAGKVVGYFGGRMEFGPRALGARSILGDARNTEMQTTMNRKIKFRESFRPFAPSCMEERTSDYFELDRPSPYMLLTAPVEKSRRRALSEEEQRLQGLEKLKVIRSDVPAVTHVDYSARIQTVHPETAPRYHSILKTFEDRTGCGLIVNTSFNIRGEPIVRSPRDAYRCFMFTDMDVLVLENHVCLKEDQPPMDGAEAYRRQFDLD
ncbi:MAG: carbamoyltransferase family protein [Planctomycetota bacterium]